MLDTIRQLHRDSIWIEVVTLVVPGFNDSDEELHDIAGFLASVSVDIPWHVTAFHPDYQRTAPSATSPHSLVRAAELGRVAGLQYVYAGNLPGRVGSLEDTVCPACDTILVARQGYRLRQYALTSQGTCPACGLAIPGPWD